MENESRNETPRLSGAINVNMRCFFPEELLGLCRFNGLDVVRRHGNYEETPFTDHSPKQILCCRNAAATR
jgi:hypothetical protein